MPDAASGKNWLGQAAERRLTTTTTLDDIYPGIPFSNLTTAIAAYDFARQLVGPYWERPNLSSAFLDGYGWGSQAMSWTRSACSCRSWQAS